jgi:hypothetical protein
VSVSTRSTTDLIFAFVRYWKKRLEYNETVHQLFTDSRKLVIQQGRRYGILIRVWGNHETS